METLTATTMTHQEGLNQVVINKVQRMIDGKAVGVQATMERLVNEGKIAQDYIAPLGVNLKQNDHAPVITFDGQGNRLSMNMPDGAFSLHDNAIGQLADRLGVPQRYLRQLASGDAGDKPRSNSPERTLRLDAAQPCPRPHRRNSGSRRPL